jgi:hypothetical protein
MFVRPPPQTQQNPPPLQSSCLDGAILSSLKHLIGKGDTSNQVELMVEQGIDTEFLSLSDHPLLFLPTLLTQRAFPTNI